MPRQPGRERDLTTGQIAELVGCARRTVAKWIDSGLLAGHRLPSAGKIPGERRVTRAAFAAFCAAHELTILAPHGTPVGVLDDDGPDDDGPNPPPTAEAALDGAQFHRAA